MFRWLRQSDIPARLAKQYEASFNLGKMAENEIKSPVVSLYLLSFMMGRNATHTKALKDCIGESSNRVHYQNSADALRKF